MSLRAHMALASFVTLLATLALAVLFLAPHADAAASKLTIKSPRAGALVVGQLKVKTLLPKGARKAKLRYTLSGAAAGRGSASSRTAAQVVDTTKMTDGAHTLRVSATYVLNGRKVVATATRKITVANEANTSARTPSAAKPTTPTKDVTAPSAPRSLSASSITATSARLAWVASTDNVGVTRYEVYGGSTLAGTTTGTFLVVPLTCSVVTTFTVRAYDAVGNVATSAPFGIRGANCPDITPPSAPSGLTASAVSRDSITLSWNPATDNVGVASYDINVNNAWSAWSPDTSHTLSGLICGTTYSIYVIALDAAGNYTGGLPIFVTTSACADTTAPSAPGSLAAGSVTQTTLSLSWSASTDNVGVAGYYVYRDGTLLGSATSTNYAVSSLSCGTTYAFTVVARDAAGNSASSSPLNATTTACVVADTTAPSAPGGLSASAVTQTSLTLSWNASTDNVGVAGYDVYRGGTLVGSQTGTSRAISGLTCGTTYALTVRARDAAGNAATSSPLNVTTSACVVADTTAPSAPSGLGASAVTQNSLTLNWTASTDNVGVAGYDVYRNGTLVASPTGTSQAIAGLTCGTTYSLTVRARDAAGNNATSSALSVTTTSCVDTTPPSAPTGLAAPSVSATAVTLSWNASTDNVGVDSYDINRNGSWYDWSQTTTKSVTGLTCGTTYAFRIVALDVADNYATSAPLNVTTSACAPDTSAPSAPSGLSAGTPGTTGLTLSWNAATDNVGVAGYDVFRGSTQVGSTTSTNYAVSSLNCATAYSFTVRARDAAGNAATSSPLSATTAACGSTTPPPPTGGTGTPSGIAMPSGNLAGWRQIFAEDFTVPAALGTMGSDSDASRVIYTGATGTKWVTYPRTYVDTYQRRPYRSDQVLSVQNGMLDFWLHNVDGQPAGANPSPIISGNSQYQTYGRYSARVKVENTNLCEYYVAWLLWPSNESMWASAESDYPEGSLCSGRQGVHGFFHYAPGQQEAFGDNSVDMHDWHTYTQEWTPTHRRYYVDDRLIHQTTNWVYNAEERWQLQTETNGNGTNSGHLSVDWVAVYAYSPTTPAS